MIQKAIFKLVNLLHILFRFDPIMLDIFKDMNFFLNNYLDYKVFQYFSTKNNFFRPRYVLNKGDEAI